jgi:hypothetical protein
MYQLSQPQILLISFIMSLYLSDISVFHFSLSSRIQGKDNRRMDALLWWPACWISRNFLCVPFWASRHSIVISHTHTHTHPKWLLEYFPGEEWLTGELLGAPNSACKSRLGVLGELRGQGQAMWHSSHLLPHEGTTSGVKPALPATAHQRGPDSCTDRT